METTQLFCGREERSFVPFGQVLTFQWWVGYLTAPHCPLPGRAGKKGDRQHHSRISFNRPPTPFSIPFMLNLKLKLVSGEKGDHPGKVTIPLRLCVTSSRPRVCREEDLAELAL